MKRSIALAACLFVSLPAVIPVAAQTVEQDGPQDEYSVKTQHAQKVFLDYNMAIRAEERCQARSFSPEDRAALEKATAQQMVAESPQIAMGAARLLTLVRLADDDMDSLVSREGCDGQRVKASLQFYDDRLANAPGVSKPLPPGQEASAAPVSGDANATPAAPAPVEVAPESLSPAGQ